MTKNPPDKFARAIAVIGTALGLISLGLSYSTYRWQQSIYQESLQERILVRLSASGTFGAGTKPMLEPKGKLGAEVTNIGLRPIYLKSVTARNCPQDQSCPLGTVTFYERDPIEGKEPPRRLESGEAAYYVTDVNFSDYNSGKDDAWTKTWAETWGNFGSKMWVRVDTTTKSLSQEVHVSRVTFSGVL
jgi:hypothetical protein